MLSALDVAKYFLTQADEEAGDTMSNLKLQKLVYYAQGFHLAINGGPLFSSDIQAWTHGPVAPAVYHAYKDYGAGAIPAPTDFDSSKFTAEEASLLDEVYNVYGQFSAWKLRNLTHEESPWLDAYRIGPNTVITPESMKEFFVSKLK